MLFHGIPLLASKIRGHNEIIKEDYNGYFFMNKKELTNKILELYSDNDNYNKIKNNARSSVQKFILDNAYKEQKSIYDDILK